MKLKPHLDKGTLYLLYLSYLLWMVPCILYPNFRGFYDFRFVSGLNCQYAEKTASTHTFSIVEVWGLSINFCDFVKLTIWHSPPLKHAALQVGGKKPFNLFSIFRLNIVSTALP